MANDPMNFPTLWYWKLAIWKFYCGMFLVLAGAVPASVMNWYQMNSVEKFIAVLGLGVVAHKFADAFIDQTISRLLQGKPPVVIPNGNGHGDTSFVAKTTTTTEIKEQMKKDVLLFLILGAIAAVMAGCSQPRSPVLSHITKIGTISCGTNAITCFKVQATSFAGESQTQLLYMDHLGRIVNPHLPYAPVAGNGLFDDATDGASRVAQGALIGWGLKESGGNKAVATANPSANASANPVVNNDPTFIGPPNPFPPGHNPGHPNRD